VIKKRNKNPYCHQHVSRLAPGLCLHMCVRVCALVCVCVCARVCVCVCVGLNGWYSSCCAQFIDGLVDTFKARFFFYAPTRTFFKSDGTWVMSVGQPLCNSVQENGVLCLNLRADNVRDLNLCLPEAELQPPPLDSLLANVVLYSSVLTVTTFTRW
jgi:hypothetical protein